jgi:hypothetical protein
MAIVAENFRQETWILRYSHECGQTGDSRIGAPPSGRPIKCAVLGAGRRTSQFMSGFLTRNPCETSSIKTTSFDRDENTPMIMSDNSVFICYYWAYTSADAIYIVRFDIKPASTRYQETPIRTVRLARRRVNYSLSLHLS